MATNHLYYNPDFVSHEVAFRGGNHLSPEYNTQPYLPDKRNPPTGLHNSNTTRPSHTPSNSLLEDDKKLFENYNRFVRGEIDQKEFQARCCTRLLFIWEWVLQFCFWNFPSALQTWYQILEKEDVWLWVDGDEMKGPQLRLIEHWDDHEGSTDLHSSCELSRSELQHAVYILKTRLQPEPRSSSAENAPRLGRLPHRGSLKPGEAPSSWRRQLDQCPDSIVRYAAIVFRIANSDPIRALDSARRIKEREARSIFYNLRYQFKTYCESSPCTSSQVYNSQLENLGHACKSLEYDVCICTIIRFQGALDSNHNFSKRMVPKNNECQSCSENGPLLVSDISWDGKLEGPRMQDNDKPAPVVPKPYLRLLWYMWCPEEAHSTDLRKWLHWLASLTIHARSPESKSQRAIRSVLACLLSPQMENWITSHAYKTIKEMTCFEQVQIVYTGRSRHGMYIPTWDDWKAAEASLRNAELALEPCREPPDICGTLGVLSYWISKQTVETPFPNFYDFEEALSEWLFNQFPKPQPDDADWLDFKSKILDGRPGCRSFFDTDWCDGLDEYLAAASILVSRGDITHEMVWGCRCDKTDPTDITRYFKNYLIHNKKWNKDAVRASWEALVSMANKGTIDFTTYFQEFSREISWGKKRHTRPGYRWRKPDSECSEEEREDREPQTTPLHSRQVELEATANSHDRAALIHRTSTRKLSKSHQVEAIRTYLLDCLSKIEIETGHIPSLLPRGKQKVSLPWKTLTQILKERGYELENWPSEVPLPGSGSELCDDNKGIHGLNAKHLRALYDATQDKERPLRFKKVGDRIHAMIRLEEAVRRQGTIRRRETSDEGEAGPSKRPRVDNTGVGTSWRRD